MAADGETLSGIPRMALDTERFDPADRLPAWQAYNEPTIEIDAIEDWNTGFNAKVTAWRTDRTLFTKLSCHPPADMHYSLRIRPTGHEYLVLRLGTYGAMRGLLGDGPVSFEQGDIQLFDFQKQLHAISGGVDQISAYFPYDTVGYDPRRDGPQITLCADSAMGRVVTSILQTTFQQLDTVNRDEANELSDGLAGMLRAIITGERELLGVCEACEQARKRAMQDFIAENLQNPDLGTALLCTTFNASRATVYRAFADLGGVAHYITAKRLQRAYWDLATGQYARGRISAVARAYGFFDAGNFNRAFRREFGMPPKDVIGARTKTAAARPSGDLLDRNIGQISRLDDLLSR